MTYCYLTLEAQIILIVICFEVREVMEYVKSDLFVIVRVKKLLELTNWILTSLENSIIKVYPSSMTSWDFNFIVTWV